jgi:F-type H+-transporting ATPase subunit c
VNKIAKIACLAFVAVLCLAVPALAQEVTTTAGGAASAWPVIRFSGAFGAAFVVIGAAFGIGKLAAAAYESMARQPEVAGNIQTAMIIAAALIEGFTFYALYICSTAVVNQ